MKALTEKQPWPALQMLGLKELEIRSRKTNYRGPLMVTSSQRPEPTKVAFQAIRKAGGNITSALLYDKILPNGYALFVCDLTDCQPMTPKDEARALVPYREGLWAWTFENIRPLEPFPVKGQLGIWNYQGECTTCENHCPDDGGFCSSCYWEPAPSLFLADKQAQEGKSVG